jgi:hypothetical protein
MAHGVARYDNAASGLAIAICEGTARAWKPRGKISTVTGYCAVTVIVEA